MPGHGRIGTADARSGAGDNPSGRSPSARGCGGQPVLPGTGQALDGASAAAYAYCRGAQPHGPSGPHAHDPAAGNPAPGAPRNVDAASPAEDVSPGGERGYGQSDTSIAASGRYVVEAWNDATGHFSACPSPKAQITGLGFSSDGGKTFTDLEGPPDAQCAKDIYSGDPSVAAYRALAQDVLLHLQHVRPALRGLWREVVRGAGRLRQVTGPDSRAALRCGQPVIAGASTQCFTIPNAPPFCSFLDKPFLAIDPAQGRLYAAYTEFRLFDRPVGAATDQGAIEASVCDLGTPGGPGGPGRGTPGAPVREHGIPLRDVGHHKLVVLAVPDRAAAGRPPSLRVRRRLPRGRHRQREPVRRLRVQLVHELLRPYALLQHAHSERRNRGSPALPGPADGLPVRGPGGPRCGTHHLDVCCVARETSRNSTVTTSPGWRSATGPTRSAWSGTTPASTHTATS